MEADPPRRFNKDGGESARGHTLRIPAVELVALSDFKELS